MTTDKRLLIIVLLVMLFAGLVDQDQFGLTFGIVGGLVIYNIIELNKQIRQ